MNRIACAAACFSLVSLLECSSSAPPSTGGVTVSSASGALRLGAHTIPDPPTLGTIEVDLEVTDVATGSARDGLTLTVTPWMPAMDHGTSVAPAVTAEGQGRYAVTGVELFMSGTWDLNIAISGPVADHAVIEYDIP